MINSPGAPKAGRKFRTADFVAFLGNTILIAEKGHERSATETRINIEDLDSLGLSPDEEGKFLQTDDTQDTNMAATSGANPSGSLAEVKLLSSAILSLTKRLDKLEETPSTKGKGKGKGKRSSQEPQSQVPAKKPAKGCSRSTSEQNASDSEDCQTLMEKITQKGNESDTESEDEILAEMQKEYEAKDSIGKDIQNP